ncbi:MAG: acyl-[ACP]--phospholipid O-acyltransferase [Coxiellaceae bacterium]|nr:acyl-[ACP]--phospholipid O-acyltransferase [Coxiellaceae bacterium]
MNKRIFIPYLLVVFFNSFVDLGHKILIQDTLFQTASANHYTLLSSILNALILLPYVFMFTPAGFISDHFSKVKVLRLSAIAVIPITLLITLSYYKGWFWLAFSFTIILGLQSAINSPAKYGYIKEIFGKSQIAKANAYVQTVTIIAILAGTFVFTLLFSHYIATFVNNHTVSKSTLLMAFAPVGFLLVAFSSIESLCTFKLTSKPASDPSSEYQIKNYFKCFYLKSYMSEIIHNKTIITCIIGLGLFWGVNQVLLASYGAYLKTYVPNASALFAQGSLAMGGIGILFGALYAGRVSKGFIETGLIPLAAAGLTIGLLLLSHLTSKPLIIALFIAYGFFGGMLIVPLNALIQFNAKDSSLGKVLAGNNFVQNLFMIVFLVLTTIASVLGANSVINLHALAVFMCIGTIGSIILLPQSLVRYLTYLMISTVYKVRVIGFDKIPSNGGALLLGNHTSLLDWAIIQIACPRPIHFVMERSIYERWYLKWLLSRLNIIPISAGASKQAIARIEQMLNDGKIVALFPEGCLSRNGQLGKFHTGFERAVQNTSATIIPFYLKGLWGTASSYATDRYKLINKTRHRDVTIAFGEPLSADSTAAQVKQAVTTLSVITWRESSRAYNTVIAEYIKRAKQMSGNLAVKDTTGTKLTHGQCLAAVIYMSKKLEPLLRDQQTVGLMLPASAGGIIANLACMMLGKTIVNLNYTSGKAALQSAIEQAEIKTIISSERFMNKLQTKGFELDNIQQTATVISMENLRSHHAKWTIAAMMLGLKLTPSSVIELLFSKSYKPEQPAAILFSSGSEGAPKGVMLSHQNLLSNIKQVSSVFNIQEHDIILGCLPLFHAFGLMATTLMPLIEGTPVICHPDPTDARTIGKLVFQNKVTVMCGTSTFLGMYVRNKKCVPQMFESLRFVIAGAEKLSDKVRNDFKQKFNLPVYEGYGCTELSPVASSNLPDMLNPTDWHIHHGTELGTVGLPLPGTAFKIVDPATLEALPLGEAGLILISGPQLMMGYLNNREKTDQVLCKIDDVTWYKTGDKGFIDNHGFLTIVDRYSRFVKIAGEMVSLSAVEQHILAALKNESADIMAIGIKDEKKGEKIALIYNMDMSADHLKRKLIEHGIEGLCLPAQYIKVDELPRLGSGKKDYRQALALL